MNPSIARVARARIASEADALLDQLADLAALDGTLTAIEDSFAMHYRTAAGGPTLAQVKSHDDALKKADQGLAIAKGIHAKAQEMVAAFPDDKTAKRALADANTMIGRFTRHIDEANKAIRTLAQKQLPPALKDAVAKVKAAASKLLSDPSHLKIDSYVKKTGMGGRRVGVTSTYGGDWVYDFEAVGFYVKFTVGPYGIELREVPVGSSGVEYGSPMRGWSQYTGPTQVVEFLGKGIDAANAYSDHSARNSRIETLRKALDAAIKGKPQNEYPVSRPTSLYRPRELGRFITLEGGAVYGPLVLEGAFSLKEYGTYDELIRKARDNYWYNHWAREQVKQGEKDLAEWQKVLNKVIAPYRDLIEKVETELTPSQEIVTEIFTK